MTCCLHRLVTPYVREFNGLFMYKKTASFLWPNFIYFFTKENFTSLKYKNNETKSCSHKVKEHANHALTTQYINVNKQDFPVLNYHPQLFIHLFLYEQHFVQVVKVIQVILSFGEWNLLSKKHYYQRSKVSHLLKINSIRRCKQVVSSKVKNKVYGKNKTNTVLVMSKGNRLVMSCSILEDRIFFVFGTDG